MIVALRFCGASSYDADKLLAWLSVQALEPARTRDSALANIILFCIAVPPKAATLRHVVTTYGLRKINVTSQPANAGWSSAMIDTFISQRP